MPLAEYISISFTRTFSLLIIMNTTPRNFTSPTRSTTAPSLRIYIMPTIILPLLDFKQRHARPPPTHATARALTPNTDRRYRSYCASLMSSKVLIDDDELCRLLSSDMTIPLWFWLAAPRRRRRADFIYTLGFHFAMRKYVDAGLYDVMTQYASPRR
jgi:hypothetical protein